MILRVSSFQVFLYFTCFFNGLLNDASQETIFTQVKSPVDMNHIVKLLLILNTYLYNTIIITKYTRL